MMLKSSDQVRAGEPRLKGIIEKLTGSARQLGKGLKALQDRAGGRAFRDHWPAFGIPPALPSAVTKSSLCKQEDFLWEDYVKWCTVIKERPRFHRKQWEFVYILKTLHQRGLLAPDKRGLGFAVGNEPLPAAFASFGCEIVATDIHPEIGRVKGWTDGNQLCFGLDGLNRSGICGHEQFRRRCSYRPVDMNAIPDDLQGFDFNWSSCSFEHLGSIEKGLAFVRNQIKTLKPGGWAIHTTEFNISSNDDTLEEENCVIFRQRDIEAVVGQLRADGHFVAELDYSLGWLPYDYKIDTPPYSQSQHLRLKLTKFVCTSIGLILQRRTT